MNAGIYKLIFSKRLNALVVVGEICSSQGKAPGTTRALKRSARGMFQIVKILGMFSSGALLVSSAWAAPAPNALPTGGQVVQGAASISQSNAQMDINQASQRAVINWQTFDVGADAKVHIIQPNQAAVLLNRVVTNKPSEIYGKIDANGQVILVNNNGIIFGKDGSASASSFTATTLDISDQDFMDGKDRYSSNGTQGEIVNHGTIEAKNGGYVALLGAKVTNDGKIITHNGTVALGAADSIAIPMTSSGKIKMQLSAGSINAAVENTKNAVIVTEGGDVYLQAAAVNSAMASIKHSGQIDTSGEQAGKAVLLADNGEITVDGSITANSTNANHKGGDIIIGRDTETGVLAKTTDVSGASLESKKGFVETSGDYLKTTAVKVKASKWLLDPTNINIVSANTVTPDLVAVGGSYQPGASAPTSEILAGDISNALSAGTNVSITTTNSGATGPDKGNITITAGANIAATNSSGTDSTLTLTADNGITVDASITATGTSKVNVTMTAYGNGQNSDGGVKFTGNGNVDITGKLQVTGTNQTVTVDAGKNNAGISIMPSANGTLTLRAVDDIILIGNNTGVGVTGTNSSAIAGVLINAGAGTLAGLAPTNGTTNIISSGGKVDIQGTTDYSLRAVSIGGATLPLASTFNFTAAKDLLINGVNNSKSIQSTSGVFTNIFSTVNLKSDTGSILLSGDKSSSSNVSNGGGAVDLRANMTFSSITGTTIAGKNNSAVALSGQGVNITRGSTTNNTVQTIDVLAGDFTVYGSGAAGVSVGASTTVPGTRIKGSNISVSGLGSTSYGVQTYGSLATSALFPTGTLDTTAAAILATGNVNVTGYVNNAATTTAALSLNIGLIKGQNVTLSGSSSGTNAVALNNNTISATSNAIIQGAKQSTTQTTVNGLSFDTADADSTIGATASSAAGTSKAVQFNSSSITAGTYNVKGVVNSSSATSYGVYFSGANSLNATTTNPSVITGEATTGDGIYNNNSLTITGLNTTLNGKSIGGIGYNSATASSITATNGGFKIVGSSDNSFGIQNVGTLNATNATNGDITLEGTSKNWVGVVTNGAVTAAGVLNITGKKTGTAGYQAVNIASAVKGASVNIYGESNNHLGVGLGYLTTVTATAGNVKITGTSGKSDGVAVGIQRASGNATIIASGDVTLIGKSGYLISGQSGGNGVRIFDGSIISAGNSNSIGNINITGEVDTQANTSGNGVVFQRYPAAATLTSTGDINITGTLTGAGGGSGVSFAQSDWSAAAPMISAGGKFTLRGNNRASATNASAAIDAPSGMQVKALSDIVVQAETNNAAVNAINFSSGAATIWGSALAGNASFRSIDSNNNATGNVLIQANQGGIQFNNLITPTLTSGTLTALTDITGKNITIDNTGAGMATGAGNLVGSGGTTGGVIGSGSIDATGAITAGTGKATGTNGVDISDGRKLTADNNISITGASSYVPSDPKKAGVGVYNKNGVITATNGKVAINGSHLGERGYAIYNNSAITGGSVYMMGTASDTAGVGVYTTATGSVKSTVSDVWIEGLSQKGFGTYLLGNIDATATDIANGSSGITIKGISNATGAYYGVYAGKAITAKSGAINITGTSYGTLDAVKLSSLAPITAEKDQVSIIGKALGTAVSTASGVYSFAAIKGASVSIEGESKATGTGAYYGVLGAGAIEATAGYVNIKGTSATANSFAVYLQNTIKANGVNNQDGSAVNISGAGNSAGSAIYMEPATAITNNSTGGSTDIKATQGNISFANASAITNEANAGAINITAGVGDKSSSSIYAVAAATGVTNITQKSNAGITMTTDGTGNLTVAKIINNGSGDVNIGAGKMLAAGNGAGGQVRTVAGNSVANNGGGKLFVYSGKATTTGTLSVLDNTNFAELYLDSSTNTQNADSNVAYGATISGGAVSQVMFREKVSVNIQDKLNGATFNSTYGDTNTKNGQNAALLSDVQGVLKVANSSSGISNQLTSTMNDANGQAIKFHVSASTVIDNMDGAIQSAAYSTADYLKANTSGYDYSKTNSKYTVDFGANSIMVVVKKLALTGVTIDAAGHTYGGTVAAGAVNFSDSNLKSGDVVGGTASVQSTAADLSTSNNLKAGSYDQKVTTVTSGNTNNDADNYTFSEVTNASSYTVAKKTITTAGIDAVTDAVYGTVKATGAVTLGMDVMTGDLVSASNTATVKDVVNSTSGNLKAGDYKQTVAGGLSSGNDKNDADNYEFSGVTTSEANYHVDKLALTGVTIEAAGHTYGGTVAAGTVKFSGSTLKSGDLVGGTASVQSTEADLSSSNILKYKAGGYDQKVSALTSGNLNNDADNYTFTPVTTTGNYTVSKLVLRDAAIADVRTTYGTAAAAGAVSFSNVQGTDDVGASASIDSADYSTSHNLKANSYKQTASSTLSGGDKENYSFDGFTTSSKNYIVDQKDITLTGAAASDKVYDSTNTATLTNAGALTEGAVNSTDNKYYSGDDVRATYSGAKFTNKNVALDSSGNAIAQGVTIQGLALSGDDKANYKVIDATDARATIFQKAITLTGAVVSSKVYDGTDTATLTNPGALTAGAANSADNKYYSSDDVSATNLGAKFTNGKNVALDSSGNVIAQGVTIQGLALSGNDKNNYKVTLGSNLTAKINPASLILSGGRIYDGTTRVAGSTLGAKGVTVNGVTESFTVTGSGNASNLNSKNASSSAQTLMDVTGLSLGSGMNGAIESNYSGLSKEGSNYVIGQRQLSAELVGSVSKVYDGTTSIDNLTTDHVNVSNWADGEGASVANLSGYYADKNVDANNGTGIVKATIGSLSANSGTDLNNYRLPSADLMARIGKITPTDLTVKVNNSAVFATQTANQAYDQGFSYQGQKNNESVADIFGTNLPTAADRVITGIDANKPLAVGSYINAFGLNKNLTALHGNYNVTVQNGDLNVIAVDKLLISIASQSDVYGNRNAANAGLADTVLAQYVLDKSKDAVGSNVVSLNVSRLADGRWQGVDSTGTNVVFSTLVNSDGHLSTGGYLNVGNYQYNATPTIPRSSVNFNDSYVNGGVLTVTPRLIKTQIPVTKTYDGNDSLIGVDLVAQNTMSGDKIALGGAGRYSQANVGTNLDYSFNGIKPVGADSANYAVTLENQSISGHDGIINPRLLTIEGGSALSKVYDRTTAATIINGKLTGLVAGESLQLLSSGNFRSAEVGKKIPVDVLYRLANGLNGNANNYRVDPNAVFEANIYTDAKQMAADVYINPVPVNPSYKTPEIKPIINELVTTQHQNELIQKQCSLEFSKECNAQLNNYENNAPRYMTFY